MSMVMLDRFFTRIYQNWNMHYLLLSMRSSRKIRISTFGGLMSSRQPRRSMQDFTPLRSFQNL
jgi:hypothetical protein